jgi:hypothetical protein
MGQSASGEEKRNRAVWGHYYARCNCGQTAEVFSSPAKTETGSQRFLRMAFGYHRWDQIMVQPDFAVYRPFDRGPAIQAPTSTSQ